MRTRFAIVSAVVTLAALTAAATAVAFDVTNSTTTGRLHPVLIRDCGPIQSGNVRIRMGVMSSAAAER
jgi:hypothetical protein